MKRREEAKALKKQKEKEKIEQQKRDGTYLTKAQREEKQRNEMKLQQMIAAGVKVSGPDSGEKKKVVYDGKKKGGRRNPEEVKVCLYVSTSGNWPPLLTFSGGRREGTCRSRQTSKTGSRTSGCRGFCKGPKTGR